MGVDGGAPQLGKEFAGRREINRADARVTPMGQAFRLVLLLCYFFFFSCVQLLGCYATLLILGATSCCLHGFFFPLSLLMGFPRSHCDMGFFEVCVYANDT